MTQVEIGDIRVRRLDRSDTRGQWPLVTSLDHRADRVERPDKQSLDRSVTTVSHPASKAMRRCSLRDPGAEANALHASADIDPADHDPARGHRISPVLSERAAFSPEEAQRSSSPI